MALLGGLKPSRVLEPLSCLARSYGRIESFADRSYPQLKRRRAMPKKEKELKDLFHDGLKDIYFAEKKILVALPKMAKAAESKELVQAFEKHEKQTKEQVSRLEKIFKLIDETPRGKNCPAITGIIDEGEEIVEEYSDSPALDAGLVGAAQAVEHYEIARYGTLKSWARELGLNDAVNLLQTTLEEEEDTDEQLSELAENLINQKAEAAE
jgi:ferritin-like metal-binding protein YciE